MAKSTRDIIVVGASAGGVQALQQVVGGLPGGFPASIFIVLHLWARAPSMLAPILSRAGPLPVGVATDGAAIERGRIYVAPSDMHLFVERDQMRVIRGPRENRTRPAINPLFRSAASAFGRRVIAVILTGTLDDGAAGLWAVKQCGGVAVVQSDPEFEDMPRSARESVAVDHEVPLREIAPLLNRLVREPVADSVPQPVPEIVHYSSEKAKMNANATNLDELGPRSVFSCPECSGALWELEEGQLQYRCHVGHAYSAEALREAQSLDIEQSVWSALRALKESAALDERLAGRSDAHGLSAAAAAHRSNAEQKLAQAEQLERFVSGLRPVAGASVGSR
jgi:two-component system, chemotaxis family, protein-glutamate methylesterase/glutaminase